ncbi:MAG: 23S rRNA (uracil(1939)-C(5))-methyltransferase RlmD [Ligilactobacillus sp.]|nr:23S rRNA (uracil(1939)-C(5))-methyltransferase RlmD [Ligilactobacillus sp.]
MKRLGINGEGIGYYRRKITFIAGVLPGEKIQAEITKVHPKYLQAQVIKILSKSPDRVKPRDKYDVGGIELEHLCYDKQLEYKRDVILQALEKFKPRGYQNYDLRPTLGMENPYAYRNKAQFQVRRAKDGHLMAGLYRSNSHFLVDLPTFSTQKPLTMKIMRTVLKLLEKWQISAYNEKTNRGDVKTIVVRESQAKKEAQVVLITRSQRVNNLSAFVGDLQVALPEVVSIMQNINPEKTSLIWGAETLRLAGSEYLEETLGDVHFRLSARAFFQLNPSQTEVLYDQVKLALDLQADESLVDAYCGVGTIGLYVSKEAKEVRGMDITPEAIVDARYNAQISGRTNVTYEVGPAEEWLPKWSREGFHPDALVVDPPRLGLDDKLIATILANPPKKFVYVSCNPSTLARDLVKLSQVYEVEYIQSVDMFPQTARCEAVVKFRRRKK